MRSLSEATFHNPFVDALPGDPGTRVESRFTPHVCFSRVSPTPSPHPSLIIASEEVAHALGLSWPFKEEDVKILSGSLVPPSSKPYALCYGGHQFGHWAGQLGDGRAITLGALKDLNGKEEDELQLKGVGRTPYSRTADGKAVLRSSVREFLASEAMHHLGVPTTRALALIDTGENVLRDMFYDGNPRAEPGAVVARVSPCFLRFGNFEILAAQSDQKIMLELLDWILERHFPHLKDKGEKRISLWFKEVCARTAFLIAQWLRVGFVHGVMNTDNMSLLGETIDYGPYGWLEEYDPSWTPNTTDLPGRRYCFGRQAPIALWNLECLAAALNVLPGHEEDLQEGLLFFRQRFEKEFLEMMARKLGIASLGETEDTDFLRRLDEVMQNLHVDMTLFYRKLSEWDPRRTPGENQRALEDLVETCYTPPSAKNLGDLEMWLESYAEKILRAPQEMEERRQRMNRANPKYILRNSMAFLISRQLEEKKDDTLLKEIFAVLKNPYDEQSALEKWAQKRPAWAAEQPGSSTLSCSS
jgi:uncharacterized protein YdiU (UPF0061 family)